MAMEIIKIKVGLSGLADIMFDRFIDHSKEIRPPEQKLYLAEGNKLVMPADNINAFLFNENPPAGCAKTFEGRKGKEYCRIGQSHVFIDPVVIPFLDENDNEIIFIDFNDKRFWVHEGAPRVKASSGSNTIKQEIKKRPVLRLPWRLRFQIALIKNPLIDEVKLYNWFVAGGMQISLGTYRPRFGRFEVIEWEII